jgi:hypothetical protein
MADDTKYKEIFSMLALNQTPQLFAIDRDFKLWTMYPYQVWNWTDWATFPVPGNSGGVQKIYGTPGMSVSYGGGNSIYFQRIWVIDLKNDLWSCANQGQTPGPSNQWTSWAEWVPPYPSPIGG